MPGLKALSDFIEGPQQSRAVAAHAASVGISSAASFVIVGAIAEIFGWRWGVAIGGIGAVASGLIMGVFFPAQTYKPQQSRILDLLDFRPVLRNRSAIAYSIGYAVHTFEMSAFRNWVVAFLTFSAAYQGVKDVAQWLSPPVIATLMGLLGVWTSVLGNEVARRIGRRRWIISVMGLGMAVSAVVGFAPAVSYPLAVCFSLLYGVLIWADSVSLTAGTTGSAIPGQRGATLACHSMLGYVGGFVGPLVIGVLLDVFGAGTPVGWGLAFLSIIGILFFGPLVMVLLKPGSLDGDRAADNS